jgi:uncharacterized membrane protein
MKKKYFGLLVLLALSSGCSKYKDSVEVSKVPLVSPSNPDAGSAAGISFAEVKSAILNTSCIECHQNYTFYDSVKQDLDKIVQAVETDRMPKNSSPLSAEQKKLLAVWVASGAHETVASSQPGEPDMPSKPDEQLLANWASLSKKVFFARCTVCHSPNGQAKFLDLSTRQKIFESRGEMFEGKQLLNFNNPEESYLLKVIQDADEPMPPKSSGFKQLDKNEIEKLVEWIRMGLPLI